MRLIATNNGQSSFWYAGTIICVTFSYMTRTRKRILVATLALLVVLTGWFYWFYFMSTNAAIRHAESFLFRRMIVSQVGCCRCTYRHFFMSPIVNWPLEMRAIAPVENFDIRLTVVNSLSFGILRHDESSRSLGLGMLRGRDGLVPERRDQALPIT